MDFSPQNHPALSGEEGRILMSLHPVRSTRSVPHELYLSTREAPMPVVTAPQHRSNDSKFASISGLKDSHIGIAACMSVFT